MEGAPDGSTVSRTPGGRRRPTPTASIRRHDSLEDVFLRLTGDHGRGRAIVKRLLAADRVRFGRRLDLWVLVALVPLVMAVLFVMEFNALTTPPSMDVVTDPHDPVAEADIRAQMLANWRAQMTIELPSFAFPRACSRSSAISDLRPSWRSTWPWR